MILTTSSAIMRHVLYALMLGIAVKFYHYGFTVLIQIFLAIIAALMSEYIVLRLRHKEPAEIFLNLGDGSALVSAILLALSIPTITPWWLVMLGAVFAIIFGKQLYGGLGHNPFNPAMLGYVFLLISFPLQMTQWQAPNFMTLPTSFHLIFALQNIDVLTAATQLETKISTHGEVFYSNVAFLLGGIYLLFRRIINWHIPIAVLLSIIVFAFVAQYIDGNLLNPWFHLTTGSTMIMAFFIATDPVSSSTTNTGRLIYGALIGFLLILIRSVGNYPDGVAFAILLANMMVPLIDYYSKPKIFGAKS